ncbi:MAG: 16S rRNA (cytidine(1402)-2'-O)-methyltransferase [Pseudomonadota bacterium]
MQGGPGGGDAGAAEGPSPASGGPSRPAPGLYLVATPIGNARDITLRALDLLASCDAIAAEDTRTTRRLMEIHGIALRDRPMQPYHDRNGAEARPRIAAWLEEGRSVAYCTDAGTPLIADPGFRLVRLAAEGGHAVTALPGPSAALVALSLSGLPTDRFMFAGFPPPKAGARARFLAELSGVPATLVLFESPHRVVESVAAMAEAFGSTRPAALARELTKRFEEVRRATLGELASALAADGPPRGEIVLVVGPPEATVAASEADIDSALIEALAQMSVKDAASHVASALGLPRRGVYARAVTLSKSSPD